MPEYDEINPNTSNTNMSNMSNIPVFPDHTKNPHTNKPTLALFANSNHMKNTVASSGVLDDGTHVILISSDNLRAMVDLCDLFISDIQQQRAIFLSKINTRIEVSEGKNA